MSLAQALLPWRRSASDPDGSLLLEAQRGSRSAFDALRRRHESLLRGFVSRRVGPDAAEDLLQDIWLACWQTLARYEGRARFKAWLYGIAAHKCVDCLRQRAQDSRKQEALQGEEAAVSNAYHAIELRQTVQEALRPLPDEQREVLELYYYAELTLAEIAQMLNRNLNTVKYQFYRAHAQAEKSLRMEGLETS